MSILSSGFSQTNPNAVSQKFVIGTGTNPDRTSFVLPLGNHTGVALLPQGSNATRLMGNTQWWYDLLPSSVKPLRKQFNSQTGLNDILLTNPVAAFGSSVGATPLYIGQPYLFGLFSGARKTTLDQAFVRIRVFSKTNLAAGVVGVSEMTIPQRGTIQWDEFVASGGVKTVTAYGLTTSLALAESSDPASRFETTELSPYILTHVGSTSDFYYQVEVRGSVKRQGSSVYKPMVLDAQNVEAFLPLYTLDFDQRSIYMSTYLQQPQFEGTPLPPSYQGKSVEELLRVRNPIPVAPYPNPLEAKAVDQSPELRSHPYLDDFVNQRKSGDPLRDFFTFSNYVLNEVALTDFISYNESGQVDAKEVNLGGMSRSALATLVEKAGSPQEQCALLIYLLRKAEIPAVYVKPESGHLKMLDKRLSQLFRIQLKGATDANGNPDVPHLIPVNYPWVAAYVNNQWIPIFPWLKDTEIKEGQNVVNLLPPGGAVYRWIRGYLQADTTILSKNPNENSPLVLFPRYLETLIRKDHPDISVDLLGMSYRDRKNYFTRIEDFPVPFLIDGTPSMLLDLHNEPSLYNTARVTITKDGTTAPIFDSGAMNLMDLHNRRLIIRHEKTGADLHAMKIALAAYSPEITGVGAFEATADWKQKQEATVNLTVPDQLFAVKVETKFHRSFVGTIPPGTEPFLNLQRLQTVQAQTTFKKGDVVAIELHPGTVSQEMVQLHGDEMIRIQNKVKNEPGYQPDPEIYQGASCYLMGLEYFNKMSAYVQTIGRLFKVNPVSVQGTGFAKMRAKRDSSGNLPNGGDITLDAASVDMHFHVTSSIYSNQVRPDQPGSTIQNQKDFSALLAVGGSAEEHLVLNRYLDNTRGISAVSLLQLAALEKTNSIGVIALTKSNYANEGLRLFNGTLLKDQDPQIWSIIDRNFSTLAVSGNAEADYQVIYVTAGKVGTGTDAKMAAVILTDISSPYYREQGVGSLITGEFAPQNGAEYPFRKVLISSPNYVNREYLDYSNSAFSYEQDYGNYFSGGNSSNVYLMNSRDYGDYSSSSGGSGFGSVMGGFMNAHLRSLYSYRFNPQSFAIPRQEFAPDDILYRTGTFGKYNFMTDFQRNAMNAYQAVFKVLEPNFFSTVVASQVNKGAQFISSAYQEGSAQVAYYKDNGLKMVSDPVSVTTGEFYVNQVDISLSGPMPLEIRRNYSSLNMADGEFGYGWKIGYNNYLAIPLDGTVMTSAEPDGTVIAYIKQSALENGNEVWKPDVANNPSFVNYADGRIGSTSNPLNAKIIKTTAPDATTPSITNTFYTLYGADGSIRTFKVESFPITSEVTRERPYLQSWVDNRGNKLTFEYGRTSGRSDYGKVKKISSNVGTYLGFSYDVYGHITEVFSSDSRRLTYTYSKDGDLVKIELPDASKIQYEYEQESFGFAGQYYLYSKHLIFREIKPEGRLLENIYDSKRRVVKQRAMVGAERTPVRNASFEYFPYYTLLYDPYGGITRYDFNTDKQIIKVSDPIGQNIVREWYPKDQVAGQNGGYPNSLKRVTDERGLIEEYQYDSRGNVLQVKRKGDLNGDGIYSSTAATDNAITKMTYNSKNLPVTVTNPAGHVQTITYDTTFPFLPAKVERRVGTALQSKVVVEYETPTTYPDGNSPRGIVSRIKRMKGVGVVFDDYAITEFENTSTGFPSRQTDYTGTTDPNLVEEMTYNLRGEKVESIRRDESNALWVKRNYQYDSMSRPIWEEDWNGANALISWNYNYYNLNGDLEWIDGPRWGTEDYVWMKYDGGGRPAERHVWRVQAKSDGTGVESIAGTDYVATTLYKHDSFGVLNEIYTPRANSITFQHDLIGRTTEVQQREGNRESKILSSEKTTYGFKEDVATRTSPLGAVTKYFYTTTGQLRRQENPDGTVQELRFDLLGRPVKQTLTNGSFWEISYDDQNRRITRTLKKGATTLCDIYQEFDVLGRVIREKDQENNIFETSYDDLGRVKSVTGPDTGISRQITTYTYDKAGKQTIVTNARGEKSVTGFDPLGRILRQESQTSSGTTQRLTSYAYSTDFQSVTITEGSGANAISRTVFTDTMGNPVLTQYPGGKFKFNSFDALGNPTLQLAEDGKYVSTFYDAKNRPILVQDSAGTKQEFVYNAADQLLERRMPENTSEVNRFDTLGRLLSTEWRAGSKVTRQYGYTYYGSGDFQGLIQTSTDPLGIVTTYTYDDFLRLGSKSSVGTTPEQTQSTGFVYDKRGLVKQITQTTGPVATPIFATTIDRTFDAYGQALTETVKNGATTTSNFTQAWDAAGNRKQLASVLTVQGSGFGVTRNFDYRSDGLLATEGVGATNYSWTYADTGLLSTATTPLWTQTVVQRDSRGRVQQQKIQAISITPLVENLTWNDNSTLSQYGVTRTGGTSPYSETRDYGYNARNFVQTETFVPAAGSASKTFTFEFDQNRVGSLGVRTLAKVNQGTGGDFLLKTITLDSWMRSLAEGSGDKTVTISGKAKGAVGVNVKVDGENSRQLVPNTTGDWTTDIPLVPGSHTANVTAQHPNANVTKQASTTFTVNGAFAGTTLKHNVVGNVIERKYSNKTQTLTWDASNRLIKVTERDGSNNGSDWSAIYDGLNRRIQSSYAVVTNNVAATANVVKGFYDPEVEFLEIGTEIKGQRFWNIYGVDLNGVYGGLNGIGGMAAVIRESNGETSATLNDYLGNIAATVSGATLTWNPTKVTGYGPVPGTPVVKLETLAAVPTATSVAQSYASRSRRIDATDFSNYGARYYHPASGHFISPDPLGHGSDMTLYAYCQDPINCVDADGRMTKTVGVAGAKTADFGVNILAAALGAPKVDDWDTQIYYNRMAAETYGNWFQKMGVYQPTDYEKGLITELPVQMAGPMQDMAMGYAALKGPQISSPQVQTELKTSPRINKLNIGGLNEAPGFTDAVSPSIRKEWIHSRPFTSEFESRSINDFFLRNTPMNQEIASEISRLAAKGARITVVGPADQEYIKPLMQALGKRGEVVMDKVFTAKTLKSGDFGYEYTMEGESVKIVKINVKE